MSYLKIVFYGSCSVALLFFCVLLGHLKANSPALIISEVKIKNDTLGFDEYIELYNPGLDSVSLNNYFIGYVNSPTPAVDQAFMQSVIAQGLLESHKSLLLAKNDTDPHLTPSQKLPFSSLADSGGTLQISDESGVIIDQVSWSATASVAIGSIVYMPGTTVSKSQSVTRSRTAQGEYVITPANWQLATPTPESSTLLPLLPTLENTDQTDPPPISVPSTTPATNTPTDTLQDETVIGSLATTNGDVIITEMLPNPAPPATDGTDEYIELYNQSSEPLNLKGYKLQSGNNFTYTYEFSDHVIMPDSYDVLKVSETHLLLSNSGGRSRLLNSSGEVVAQTETYGSAAAGKAWILIDGIWQWSDIPTPGAANIASALGTTTTKTSKITVAKTAKPAVKTTKPVKTTTSKAKTPTTVKKSATGSSGNKNSAAPNKAVAGLHPFILAGVGVSALLYGLYEYRHDVINLLQRLRRNRSFRRSSGQAAQGARGD